MRKLPRLKQGDRVEIIAPASRCADVLLQDLNHLLTSWGLNCVVAENIFGDDLLCANSDSVRFSLLKQALYHPDTKAVICARGGYGSMRLIPELAKLSPSSEVKLFVGMSDITALNLYLQQQWGWPTIHGALALDKFSPESIANLKGMLFGEVNEVRFVGKAMNAKARESSQIEASVTGGNLCVMQAGMGTDWEVDGKGKIILLEEVGERGYRVDRMLAHLMQAGVFDEAKAIVIGDFLGGDEPDGSSLVAPVLQRFAEQCGVPVVRIAGVGHGYQNLAMPLGTRAVLKLGNEVELVCGVS
jgi:muramoyltetrapeptide carboxypeptidase